MSQKKMNIRRRRKHSSDEDDVISDVVETAKELQKIRRKQGGVSALSLATGERISKEEEMLADADPFKMKVGGLTNMRLVKDRNRDRTYEDVDRDVTNLGNTFSAETNRRDEDAEMTSYVEFELRKRKGIDDDDKKANVNPFQAAEDALYAIPAFLQIESKTQSEEMLSNQMLNGIPEVDLGIETKIRNIERTEEAKQKLIEERFSRIGNASLVVAGNVAVNYVQHKRYHHHEDKQTDVKKPRKLQQAVEPPLVVGDTERKAATESVKRNNRVNKASDDFHYDKFRRNARKY